MAVLTGCFVVFLAVITGYLISGGEISSLVQPPEFLMLVGASIGFCLVSNTNRCLKKILPAFFDSLRGSQNNSAIAADLLSLMFVILSRARHEGMLVLDTEINRPYDSEIFQRYPRLLDNAIIMSCIIDCLRLRLMGNLNEQDIDMIMMIEADALEEENTVSIDVITRLADAMPAFGIITAVLGVIHSLGSMDRSTFELSSLVSQAMVGTLLGILFSYGFISPLATRLELRYEEVIRMMNCVRLVMVADMRGYAPHVALDFGRKTLYSDVRPSFDEMEKLTKKSKNDNINNLEHENNI